MNWIKTNLANLAYWAQTTFGCSINPWSGRTGLSYKMYCALAGALDCMCCIFWRGLFIGAIIGIVFSILLYFIERFFL